MMALRTVTITTIQISPIRLGPKCLQAFKSDFNVLNRNLLLEKEIFGPDGVFT